MGRTTDRRIPMARPLSLLLELRIAVRIYQIIPITSYQIINIS